jgi:predicted metal-dependent hydrolase
LRVCKFLFVSPGILRRIAVPYLSYYLPTFHPWRHDDRHLIAAVERELAADGTAST